MQFGFEMVWLKQPFVINLLKNVQLATDSCVEHFAAVRFVGFARHAVGDFGSLQVGQLPAEALAEIGN